MVTLYIMFSLMLIRQGYYAKNVGKYFMLCELQLLMAYIIYVATNLSLFLHILVKVLS